ncbi:MAG: TlyA family RNA methyltransferase [Lachnospiraceae bacterium]|nr:TlyA family RNA methyltransferase [Lachnospiraceae bacterium]
MKKRLDILVTEGGHAASREKARAMIMAGIVYVDGVRCDKAGTSFEETAAIEIRGEKLKYVSRGGLKLEKALDVFGVSVDGRVCLDIGSSTGGFTDCMLMNGAVRVYAIDVGRGQLDWKLRNDPRVVSMEKTNIRYVEPEDLPETAQFASIDVSFISLIKVLIPVRNLLDDDGSIVCLIKPQFEAGRAQVGKHGVVRDPEIQGEVIRRITSYALTVGLTPVKLDYSPIRGPEGNIEFLCWMKKKPEETDTAITEDDIARAVFEAHSLLA